MCILRFKLKGVVCKILQNSWIRSTATIPGQRASPGLVKDSPTFKNFYTCICRRGGYNSLPLATFWRFLQIRPFKFCYTFCGICFEKNVLLCDFYRALWLHVDFMVIASSQRRLFLLSLPSSRSICLYLLHVKSIGLLVWGDTECFPLAMYTAPKKSWATRPDMVSILVPIKPWTIPVTMNPILIHISFTNFNFYNW